MKKIVVTGATRGLGRSLADRFIEAGHTVLGCGRSGSAIESLRQRYGPPHQFNALDVTDDAAVAAWADRVLADHGPPDLLLNNAALIHAGAPLWQVPPAQFNAVIDVNIKGVTNVIRHFVPAMVARGRGVIVNFSSTWGRTTSGQFAPYCASKWAIEGLTRALAQELPAGMAAVPLNPGVIDTDMLRLCLGDEAAGYPGPEVWSHQAAKVILGLDASHNGKPWSVR
jgi:NAD(P)-dependent dehydrogenase (short-subunit alcohol dehydrogenase family)